MWKTSKPGTHPVFLSSKANQREVQMASRSGTGATGCWTGKGEEADDLQHSSQRPSLYCLSQARGEGRQGGWGHRDPWHSKGLRNESSHWKTTQISRRDHHHQPPARYCALVPSFQTPSAPIELMVPCEERIEEANERKQGKYQSIIPESQQRGWRAWNLPVEVS